MRILSVIVVAILICQACQNNQDGAAGRKDAFSKELKTKEDTLFHEVMEGHDVGMAKMGSLKRAIKNTQAALDSVNKLPSAKLDESYQQALVDLQEDLNYAEYGMNRWMEEFILDSANDNRELRIKYLQSEKEKVNKVRDNILNGLARADSLLKK